MSIFSGLKFMIAKFLSEQTAVVEIVSKRLLGDPKHLALAFESICNDNKLLEKQLLRRDTFDALLRRLSANPEALFLMLSASGGMYYLSAQSSFLEKLINNARILELILENKLTRDRIFERIASDRALLNEILILSAACLVDDSTTSSRINIITQDIARSPIFLLALQKDPDLRQSLLKILLSGYASAGEDMAHQLEILGKPKVHTI